MDMGKMDVKMFKGVLEEVVRKVVAEELAKLKLDLLPFADEKEMKLLERTFHAPERYKENYKIFVHAIGFRGSIYRP